MSVVKRYPVAAFVVLAYAVSWSLVPMGDFLPCGPLVAALFVIPVTQGRAGLRRWAARLIQWRVGWVWWIAALALPLGVLAVSVALNVAAGAPPPSQSQFSPWYALIMVAALRLINPLDGPVGEEPGFRGFAQPQLQRSNSPLVATSILAIIVAGWHLPLLFMNDMRPIDLVSTMAVTFWYAWLFNRSGGSVLITVVAHSAQGTIEHGELWTLPADAARLNSIYAAVACAVVAGLLVADWRFWQQHPAPPGQHNLDEATATGRRRRPSHVLTSDAEPDPGA